MNTNELFDVMNFLFVQGYSEDSVTYVFENSTLKQEFSGVIGDCDLDGRYIAVYLKDSDEYEDFWKNLYAEVGIVEYEILTFWGTPRLVVLFKV